jgi:hypothetical protein
LIAASVGKSRSEKAFGRIRLKPASKQAIHSSNKYKNQDTKNKDRFRECFWFVSILAFFSILGSK